MDFQQFLFRVTYNHLPQSHEVCAVVYTGVEGGKVASVGHTRKWHVLFDSQSTEDRQSLIERPEVAAVPGSARASLGESF